MPRRLVRAFATHARNVQVGAHPTHQFTDRERLGEVVRCSGIQAFDGGLVSHPGRQHDHRDVGKSIVLAHRPNETEAVEVGHDHVGHHEIGGPLPRRFERRSTVHRDGDRPPGREDPTQVVAHVGVVIDDEHVRRAIGRGVGVSVGVGVRDPVGGGGLVSRIVRPLRQPATNLAHVGGSSCGRTVGGNGKRNGGTSW